MYSVHVQDGNILAWKFNVAASMFQPAATLWGHSAAILTLEVSDGRLYSGSMDNTIKVSFVNCANGCL
jgi:pleiotropic regulator 1